MRKPSQDWGSRVKGISMETTWGRFASKIVPSPTPASAPVATTAAPACKNLRRDLENAKPVGLLKTRNYVSLARRSEVFDRCCDTTRRCGSDLLRNPPWVCSRDIAQPGRYLRANA